MRGCQRVDDEIVNPAGFFFIDKNQVENPAALNLVIGPMPDLPAQTPAQVS
jgi:hypothetical protein